MPPFDTPYHLLLVVDSTEDSILHR